MRYRILIAAVSLVLLAQVSYGDEIQLKTGTVFQVKSSSLLMEN
jgi:hypothetical protein